MSNFSKNWKKDSSPGLAEKVKESISPQGPLAPRLSQASTQIKSQVNKIDSTISRLKEKDKIIFNKVSQALQRHDAQTASAMSNELTEVRKMSKIVNNAKVVLEQIDLRLTTVHELGDIVSSLTPAVGVIRSIKTDLGTVIPGAESEIGEINSTLSGLLVDAGTLGGFSLNFAAANEDSEKILAEASAIAEQRMKEKFPDLPASGYSRQSESSSQV